jgi:hypothetical protein
VNEITPNRSNERAELIELQQRADAYATERRKAGDTAGSDLIIELRAALMAYKFRLDKVRNAL